MNTPRVSIALLLATFAAATCFSTARAADDGPPSCDTEYKNHYILCDRMGVIQWQPAALPIQVHGKGATATSLLDGRVLVAGGQLAPYAAEIYEPATGTWIPVQSMNVPRSHHVAVRLHDGRVLAIAGRAGANTVAEVFDPGTLAWTPTAELNFHRSGSSLDLTATVLDDGTVLVAGGALESEIYDPALNTWRAAGNLWNYRVGHTATLLEDGRVLLLGGIADWEWYFPEFLPSPEIYDPSTAQWMQLPAPSPGFVNHTATTLLDGRILVAGGSSTGQVSLPASLGGPAWPYQTWNRAYLFDADAAVVTTGAPGVGRRYGHLAISLESGRVLVIGGFNDTAPVATSEIYWPEGGVWMEAVQLGAVIEAPVAAVPLPDGTILVLGIDEAALLRVVK